VASYVLNVRPHSSRHVPFTLSGPDLGTLLQEALSHITPA
jgi:hypothetical protein